MAIKNWLIILQDGQSGDTVVTAIFKVVRNDH